MEQTPIEKAIERIKEHIGTGNKSEHDLGFENGLIFALTALNLSLPYEKTYHRNIAEKAWDASKKAGYCIGDTSHPDKQTYLNQNHPL